MAELKKTCQHCKHGYRIGSRNGIKYSCDNENSLFFGLELYWDSHCDKFIEKKNSTVKQVSVKDFTLDIENEDGQIVSFDIGITAQTSLLIQLAEKLGMRVMSN